MMLRLCHGRPDMMAIKKYAATWCGVTSIMIGIMLVAGCISVFTDYLPDELTDGTSPKPLNGFY